MFRVLPRTGLVFCEVFASTNLSAKYAISGDSHVVLECNTRRDGDNLSRSRRSEKHLH
jgi:hypothetical protein